ncbi:hypothetical protein ABCS02_20355 [Microbacterium sp. X-17]|uniref:hypothetical protein n=1 Tax=Microbacterium sp. X-17 TaxID=3144404 RepID=UPI0031F4D776
MRRTASTLLALIFVATATAGCAAATPVPTGSATAAPAPTNSPACAATDEGTGEIALLVAQGGFGSDYMVADISSVYTGVKTTQRSVRIPGDAGPAAQPGSTVTADYAIFNGVTGAEIVTTVGGSPQKFVLDPAQTPVGIVKVLTCATPNTRLAGIIPASEGFTTPPPGFPTGVPLLVVADVRSVTN